MARSVQMPPLGESVTEGTVSRWLKKVGDRVEVDEPLVEVTTDKVDTEIPAPFAGTLQRIIVAEDETAEVGAELAVIGEAEDAGAPEVVSTPEDPAAAHDTPDTVAEEVTQAEIRPQDEVDGAATEIHMPALGESVTEGTVTRWLVSVGDTVAVDQPLLEVSTDKVDTEVPSPVAGTVSEIVVAEDETVAVGAVLAKVGGGSDVAAAEPAPQPTTAAEPAPQPTSAADPVPDPPAPAPGAEAPSGPPAADPADPAARPDRAPAGDAVAYVTPIVRKLAAELNVDLAGVRGTGVGGRVRRQDVTAAAEAAEQAAEAAAARQAATAPPAGQEPPAAAPTPARQAPTPAAATQETAAARPGVEASPKRGTTEAMSRTRRVIAARMMASLQTSAQLTTVVEVDVTRVARLRARSKADFEAREGVKLSFMPFFALAAVEALKVHPVINASTDGESITYHQAENLGVAVDTERGLMVPVIRDAGDLNLAGLARRISDLAERTRARRVGPDDLSGSTFTLTNTGSRGALFDTPIINQPEVAILGTGAVVKRPVVVTDVDGSEGIAVRSMVYLALSYDHRIVDGADAARFLVTVRSRLEEGAFEPELGL